MVYFILGAIVGLAAGWGVTYLWFKRTKIVSKITTGVK
jgi:hypothetical protein